MNIKAHLEKNAPNLIEELNLYLKEKGVLTEELGLQVDKIRFKVLKPAQRAGLIAAAGERVCLQWQQTYRPVKGPNGQILYYEVVEKCVQWSEE